MTTFLQSLSDSRALAEKAATLLNGQNQTLHDNAQQTLQLLQTQERNAYQQLGLIIKTCQNFLIDAKGLSKKVNETQLACDGFQKIQNNQIISDYVSLQARLNSDTTKINANNQYQNDIKPVLQQIADTLKFITSSGEQLKEIQQKVGIQFLFDSELQKNVFDLLDLVLSQVTQTQTQIKNISVLNTQVNQVLKKVNITSTTSADEQIQNLISLNTKNVDLVTTKRTNYTQLVAAAKQNQQIIKNIDVQFAQQATMISNSTDRDDMNNWRSLMNKIIPFFSDQTSFALEKYQQMLQNARQEAQQVQQKATDATQLFYSQNQNQLAQLKGDQWQRLSSLNKDSILAALSSLTTIKLEIELDRNATQIVQNRIFERSNSIRYDAMGFAMIHGQILFQKETSFKLDRILSQNITIADFISQFQSDSQSIRDLYQKYQNSQTLEQQECKTKHGEVSSLFDGILSTYDPIKKCLLLSQDELVPAFSYLSKFQRNNTNRWEDKGNKQKDGKKFYRKVMDDFVSCPINIDKDGNSGMNDYIGESNLASYKIYKALTSLRECQGIDFESKTTDLINQISQLQSKTVKSDALGCIFNESELENALRIQQSALNNSDQANKLIKFLELRFNFIKNLEMACWGKLLADSKHKQISKDIFQLQSKAMDMFSQMKSLFSNWVKNLVKVNSCCDVFPFYEAAMQFLTARAQFQDMISIQLQLALDMKKPPQVMSIVLAESRLLQLGKSNDQISKLLSKIYETDEEGANYMYVNERKHLMESLLKVATEAVQANQESKQFHNSLLIKALDLFKYFSQAANYTTLCQNHDEYSILLPIYDLSKDWRVFESEVSDIRTQYKTSHESNMESLVYNDQHRVLAEQTFQLIKENQSTQISVSPSQMQFFIKSQLWALEARDGLSVLNTTQANSSAIQAAAKEAISSLENDRLALLFDQVLDIQSYVDYQNMYYDFGQYQIPWDRKINATLVKEDAHMKMAITGMKLGANEYLVGNLTGYTISVGNISKEERLLEIQGNVIKIVRIEDKTSDSDLKEIKAHLSSWLQYSYKTSESKLFSCIYNRLSDVHMRFETAESLRNQTEPQYSILKAFIQYMSVSPLCDYVWQNKISMEKKLFFDSPIKNEQATAFLDAQQYQQCVSQLVNEIGSLSVSYLKGVIIPIFGGCLMDSIAL